MLNKNIMQINTIQGIRTIFNKTPEEEEKDFMYSEINISQIKNIVDIDRAILFLQKVKKDELISFTF